MLLAGLPLLALAASPALADDAGTNRPDVNITPITEYVTVSGDRAKFREDWGIKEGWNGGIDDATYHQTLHKDWDMNLEARAIFDEEDYKLRLSIANPDVGFVHAGYTEFREYSDNLGGFYKDFTPVGFDSRNDLFLRNGDAFIEGGLTLPNLPKVTLGYERQFRSGNESTLEWGPVTQTGSTRNIYPSYQHIDETADILKLQVEHDISIVHIGDQFRYEYYRYNTTTVNQSLDLDTSSSQTVTINEKYNNNAFYNTFVMDSHVNDKLYWSLGYLFTALDGNAGTQVNTLPFSAPQAVNWTAQGISLGADSHTVDLNVMAGPFAGLDFTGSLEGQKTENHGLANATLAQIGSGGATNSLAALLHGDDDMQSLEERLGVRFIKIPYTTLYAEGKWTEQSYNLDEEATAGAPAFQQNQDTGVFRQDYSVGFNTAPLPKASLSARYCHSIYQNDYDNEVDTIVGYPGFITQQDFTSDELMARLTLRPISRVMIAVEYQLVATDIRTSTEAVPALGTPAGTVQSGGYDCSIYSISATLTPISRLYLTSLFSLQETHTSTFVNGSPSVASYIGNVYSVLAAAGYALDQKTDLNLQYEYSRANDLQNNAAFGLPLGSEYQRTGVSVGLTRKLTDHIMAKLRYGFYQLEDPGNGGLDNYTAQLASASCLVKF
jgi:hypothetical protein